MTKELSTMKEWEEQMALEATEAAADETTGGMAGIISTENKQFSIGDSTIGSEMEVVIAGSAFEYSYYDRPYERGVFHPPACFAISVSEVGMVPHTTSPDKQAEACSECAYNEFGSALQGKGKMCKNSRRLGVYAYHDGAMDTSELAVLKLAPTSLKNYAKYVKLLAATMGRPVWGVVTKLSFDPGMQYPLVIPTFVKPIEVIGDLEFLTKQKKLIRETLVEPFDVSGYEPPVANAARSKMS